MNNSQSVPLDTSTTADQATDTPPAAADTTAANTQTPATTTPAPVVDPQQNAVVPPSQANFYVSYQGQQALKGMTTTLVLGNAFDKEYWSPQGIPQDGRNGKIFVSYQW